VNDFDVIQLLLQPHCILCCSYVSGTCYVTSKDRSARFQGHENGKKEKGEESAQTGLGTRLQNP